jgi:hypothetical protein
MAESKMNRYLRTKDMVVTDHDVTIDKEYVQISSLVGTGFAGVKSFSLNKSVVDHFTSVVDYPLEFMADGEMSSLYSGATGKPKFYNVSGSYVRFAPAPDATYTGTLTSYVLVPALSGSNASNWVLTSHPDAYMYGAMGEICGYLRDPVGAKTWETAMYSILDEIQGISAKDQAGGSMAVRVA